MMDTTPEAIRDAEALQQRQILLSGGRLRSTYTLTTFPWWVAGLLLVGVWIVFLVTTDNTYGNIFRTLRNGVVMTLRVSFFAYGVALGIGLIVGLARLNPPRVRRNPLATALKVFSYNLATFYVEVLRGLPILVVLLMVAFVVVPQISSLLGMRIRGSSPEAAIFALSLTYGAFLSEVFRAGIKSIDSGQVEAARSLGMNYFQAMRYVVLPQAIRIILPPLGNDLIAMIKDSSLVAILGIRDITQLAKLSSGQNFLYMQTYSLAAMFYLSMTIIGSFVVKWLERRLHQR